MANRIVYGRSNSENGWPMVDAGSCQWVTVPGTNVSLQIREGQPAKILGAFVADINAYVENVTDADSGCWTPTNSVASSNHLSGTACDVSWNRHPFHVRNTYNAAQRATIRELLDWYEDTVFWGGDWNSPIDEMHYQMGYDTYGSQNVARVQDFINRKIRPDGFSTFRRGGSTAPAPAPQPAVDQVQVLANATGLSRGRAAEILPAVVDGLAASSCKNVNRIAMWLAQIGHESDNFNATEEYDKGDGGRTERWKYLGRTWIQLTWASNYAGFSQWCYGRGLVNSPTYFVDRPAELAELKWAGLGAAYYWTVARPQINSLCDARDLLAVTKAINGGTNGLPDRQNRYNRALAVGDALLALATSTSTPTQEDDMAQVPQEQWDRVYRELTQRLPSRSPLRHLGEGPVDTLAGFVLNADGSEHVEIVRLLAGYGHPPTLALLREVAGADPVRYPDRQEDRKLAQAILAEVTATPAAPAATVASVAPTEPQIVYLPAPTPEPVAAPPAPTPEPVAAPPAPAAGGSTGQIIGQAYDALEALQLSGVLEAAERAPLSALITVLQTKTQGASA
ncbi:endolysin [Mycobacterium phage Aminay]|uniref:Lysin A n=1 Tax=Mycobacterium phage Aminay TaxID=2250291 RepID=A0A345KV15_9CAUD|nr:endolysin [Mycobacterium phage Aminay]AXH46867.1 lysin A [Mycobacterium phage Aminay]